MDAFSGILNSAEIATFQWFYLIPVLLGLVSAVLISVSRWRIFKKLDMPGWKGIIPIYSDYKLFKTGWRVMPFWVLTVSTVVYFAVSVLTSYFMVSNFSTETFYGTADEIISYFTPYLVISGLSALVYLIISFVITLNLNYQLAKSFGDGAGFALGLTILPIVFYPLLAFEKSKRHAKRDLYKL